MLDGCGDMKKKLTIGYFIDAFYPMVDGVILVVDNYARHLSKYANVILFAPEDNSSHYDDFKLPYKVVRCKSAKVPIIDYVLPLPKLDKDFMKELSTYKLDVIHIHSPFTLGRLGIEYAKTYNIPVIATMHSQFKQDFRRAVHFPPLVNALTKNTINVFEKCDECWTMTEELVRVFKSYGYTKSPRLVSNATDMKKIVDIKKACEEIDIRYKIKPEEKVLLFTGRLNKLKNIFFIIDSLKILKDNYPEFKYKMLFVGSGQDEKELAKRIEDNNLKDSIIMCGRITDRTLLAYHYARADLFLFPSLYDASSLVQVEAASQGTPTLFIESVTAATVTNGVNGYITKNDSKMYADKIVAIFQNEKEYQKVCKNAYKDLYKNWESVTLQAYKIYLKLIEKRNKNDKCSIV